MWGAEHAGNPIARIGFPQDNWTDAMQWISQTPADTHVLADPGHAWKYGSSVRVTGERDVYLEEVKDLALALYSRDVAVEALRRIADVRDFDSFTPEQLRALAARYDLDYLVVERDVDLPVVYRNEQFRVYRCSRANRSKMDDRRSTIAVHPPPRWKGGHWMTLYAWGRPRTFPALPPPQPRFFDVAPGTRVLAHCHWQPRPWEHPTLIALHGLESSSDAHYVRGLADKAFAAGFNAVRLNQRNCGATEHLSDSLYHSGLTGDPMAVMRELVDVDGLTGVCGRRLFARRQSHAEAGRRFRRQARRRSCAPSARSHRRWIWRCAWMRWKKSRTRSTSGTSSET